MARKLKVLLIVFVVLFISGSTIIYFSSSLWPSPDNSPVRVGWLTGDLHHLAYFVAKSENISGEKSMFQKYGLSVIDANPMGYVNGPAEMDAIAAGEIDIGFLGLSPAITKHLNTGTNISIIGQVNTLGSALVVKKALNDFKDLESKTIATPGPGTIQYFLLLKLCEEKGVNIGAFDIVKLAPADMKPAMESGAINAFLSWEPYCSDAVIDKVGSVYVNSGEIWADHICCVMVASNDFVAGFPDVLINFTRAIIEAKDWINNAKTSEIGSKEHSNLVDIAEKFTGRTTAVIELALRNINYKCEIDTFFINGFIEFTDKLIDYQMVPSDRLEERGYNSIIDLASGMINTEFMERAKEK